MHLYIMVEGIVVTVNDDLKDNVGAVNGIAKDLPREGGD
jgi:glycine cleavage system H lipoate-binding protein